jgi:hypothetical protein
MRWGEGRGRDHHPARPRPPRHWQTPFTMCFGGKHSCGTGFGVSVGTFVGSGCGVGSFDGGGSFGGEGGDGG